MSVEIDDPAALLDALHAGAAERRELPEIEALADRALASGNEMDLRLARRVLRFARAVHVRHGESTARLDALLARVRERLRGTRSEHVPKTF